jgi:cytochrome c-type biogenesis protein CcmH
MANCQWRIASPSLAIRHLAAALAALFITLSPAQAVQPGEMLKDTGLEVRARRLSQELRCVVCQNQSIDDSNAPLAHDLRVIVRERLAAGDSDAEVLAFVEARYGPFVLLRPRLTTQTVLLWLTPLLLLAGAAAYLVGARRRPTGVPPETAPLSAEERRRLAELMRADATGSDPSRPASR